MIKIRQDKQPDVSQDIEVWLEEGDGDVYLIARNTDVDYENVVLILDEDGITRISYRALKGIELDDVGRVVDNTDD